MLRCTSPNICGPAARVLWQACSWRMRVPFYYRLARRLHFWNELLFLVPNVKAAESCKQDNSRCGQSPAHHRPFSRPSGCPGRRGVPARLSCWRRRRPTVGAWARGSWAASVVTGNSFPWARQSGVSGKRDQQEGARGAVWRRILDSWGPQSVPLTAVRG